ncbi:hypothetical protein JCM8202_001748 [Rhodotorula sphaerocarpa]
MLSTLSASVSGYFSRPPSQPSVAAEAGHDAGPHEAQDTSAGKLAVSAQDASQERRRHSIADPGTGAPHTPEQHSSSARYSPNSLSLSGNQTMASVLSAHPHFSIFRKSTSLQNLDELARRQEEQEEGDQDERPDPAGSTSSARSRNVSGPDFLRQPDDDLVETLATPPPGRSPRARTRLSDSPSGRANGRNSSSDASFHLDSAELPSLNFGDQSSGSLVQSLSGSPVPSAAPSPRASGPGSILYEHDSAVGQNSGIRLVPDSPPTATRTPARVTPARPSATETPPPNSAPGSSRMRSSRGPVERVQFSPLGLGASPLLSAPSLPPPPPPPLPVPSTEPAPRAQQTTPPAQGARATSAPSTGPEPSPSDAPWHSLSRKGSNGILKPPKTPGTGRSVRFSSSTIEQTVERWVTPEDGSGSFEAMDERDQDAQDTSPCQHGEQSGLSTDDAEGPEGGNDSSALVNFSSASFLSRLQATIPSPDSSLEKTSPPVSPPLAAPSELPASPGAAESEPVALTDGDRLRSSAGAAEADPPSQKRPRARHSLLDESNPFLSLQLSRTDVGEESHSLQQNAGSEAAPTATIEEVVPTDATDETSDAMITREGPVDEATLLMQASLRGSTGAPSFGGQSFAEVSHAARPTARSREVAQPALDVLDEAGEEETTAQHLDVAQVSGRSEQTAVPSPPATTVATRMSGLATSAGTPSRPSPWSLPNTTPRRPSPLTQEAEFSFMSNSSASESASLAASATSPQRASGLSFSTAHPSASSESEAILDESAGSLVEIRPIDPSPPPAYQAASTQQQQQQQQPAAPSSTATPSQSSSFYRQFMAARAREGLSRSAKEEWDRLERGEKASPKENSLVEATPSRPDSSGDDCLAAEEDSVYWSPQKEEADGSAEARSIYIDAAEDDGDASLVGVDGARAAYLSPIAEVTEPESDANTPLDKDRSGRASQSRRPPPSQPAFGETSLVLPDQTPGRSGIPRPPATPRSASKVPRPRNPITPSQNPFLLQLARTTTNNSQAGTLLHDLFSTQEDQLAASASQRFLLSSLVTNLQDEVEQKNAMVENLKRQVEVARAEARDIEQLALSWEQRAQQHGGLAPPSQLKSPVEAKKLAALEETVRLLADELETRMRDDRARRRQLEKELERTRTDLVRAANEHRDDLIRLKHAKTMQSEADEELNAARAAAETADEQRRRAEQEREELRVQWRIDAEQRDQLCAQLREDLRSLKSERPDVKSDEAIEQEVQRRVDVAVQASAREVRLVKHELEQRDAALGDLRAQLHTSQAEVARLNRAVQEERQHAELASADLGGLLASREQELKVALHEQHSAQYELHDVNNRLYSAEAERDRLADTLASKEAEFAQQAEQSQTALTAMMELESAVARVERDLAGKERELQQVRRDLSAQKEESDNVLEKRDRVLAETEKEAGRLRKELESVRGENSRLSELVGKLRLDSADREVKVAKLKKRAAELEEDVFGLNIALDAKQQEASHYKRQLKVEKEERALAEQVERSTASRSALGPTVASARTSTASRRVAASRKSHATTPFPAEKARRSRSDSEAGLRRPADRTSDETESHDLTLPPLHDGNEETPSRPAQVRPARRVSSAGSISTGVGLPRAVPGRPTPSSRRLSEEAKENEAPPSRRREATLA